MKIFKKALDSFMLVPGLWTTVTGAVVATCGVVLLLPQGFHVINASTLIKTLFIIGFALFFLGIIIDFIEGRISRRGMISRR